MSFRVLYNHDMGTFLAAIDECLCPVTEKLEGTMLKRSALWLATVVEIRVQARVVPIFCSMRPTIYLSYSE